MSVPPRLEKDSHTGRKLGRYDLLCQMSSGGMSQIFLALQQGVGGFSRPVVLKCLGRDIGENEGLREMFMDEGRLTAAFSHPNIAQLFDVGMHEGEPFLAMEFIFGATLLEVARSLWAEKRRIPTGFALATAHDTAQALHYAHTFTDAFGRPRQVIHRDVSGNNIMVSFEGVTKLLDFGIAKVAANLEKSKVQGVKGTSGYMAPEQIQGEKVDARTDVFALGVVLHECLTGNRLFARRTFVEEMEATIKVAAPKPSKYNKEVTAELDAVVMKALEKNPRSRFDTALEFSAALEATAGSLFWKPDRRAELISKAFSQRRDQARALMSSLEGDSTSVIPRDALKSLLRSSTPGSAGIPSMPFDPPAQAIPTYTPTPGKTISHRVGTRPTGGQRAMPPTPLPEEQQPATFDPFSDMDLDAAHPPAPNRHVVAPVLDADEQPTQMYRPPTLPDKPPRDPDEPNTDTGAPEDDADAPVRRGRTGLILLAVASVAAGAGYIYWPRDFPEGVALPSWLHRNAPVASSAAKGPMASASARVPSPSSTAAPTSGANPGKAALDKLPHVMSEEDQVNRAIAAHSKPQPQPPAIAPPTPPATPLRERPTSPAHTGPQPARASPQPAHAAAPQTTVAVAGEVPPTAPQEHERPAARAHSGRQLILTTKPEAEVTVAHRVVGNTPLSLSLSPGHHDITLTGPDGVKHRLDVEISALANTELNVELDDLPIRQ